MYLKHGKKKIKVKKSLLKNKTKTLYDNATEKGSSVDSKVLF